MADAFKANRGRALEELFDMAVAGKDFCYFQKQHNLWVPWQGKAFPAKGAPIDFVGAVAGVPVAVECKEVTGTSFPFSRLPLKEFDALQRFRKAGGKPFLLVMQKPDGTLFLAPFEEIEPRYLQYMANRNRRGYGSVRLTEFLPVPSLLLIADTLLQAVAGPGRHGSKRRYLP